MKITLLTGKTFDISEAFDFDIKIIQSPSSRKLILRIDQKERIPVLTVPKYCSRKRAIEFVNENMDWIINTIGRLPQSRQFCDGEKFLLFGQEVTIKHQADARRGVWLEDNILYVSGTPEFLHRRVRDYIKKQAAEKFYKLSAELANRIGCKLSGVSIKDTKSRWGSCSSLNHINYSWRIALAPEYVINYLMAHEVSHLKHPDHSEDFWLCVATLYPNWKEGRDWLKKHGKILYTYQ
ncbi:MAG: M48 family metallopeptidase [Alphaproteobacteria bacterium]|nr:M48 family metallopeptidase [Alphaproteobacteria bacterium]